MACIVAGATAALSPVRAAKAAGPTPQAVDKAIANAGKYLWSRQEGSGGWPSQTNKSYPVGASALAAYALLESGAKVDSPKMRKALEFLNKKTEKTYSLGLRANVYLAAAKKDPSYRKLLLADVVQIANSTKNGSYNYQCRGDGNSAGDNSNSQYGLLGVWAGARDDLEISSKYWLRVQKHWMGCQGADGGWSYHKGASTATMTAGGVASLFVCYDNLLLRDSGVAACRRSAALVRAQKPIQAGLDWFDKNFDASLRGKVPMGHGNSIFYYLYGVERVGLASGYKYFGKADWYKLGAARLLREQKPNGKWDGPWGDTVCTSFALLFLMRGRHAVAFNKLQFNGDWNNRPRDMANLTRQLTRMVETTVNWQIINLSVPVSEWQDAPILYISGAKAPKFTERELDSIRTFVHQGGTIFSVTECNGSGFTEGIFNAYGKMFPNYKVKDCPPDHPLYNVYTKLSGRPKFAVVSNGVRPLAIHSRDDLSRDWQQGNVATRRYAFDAAANVYMYVTDKLSSVRGRGTTLWPAKARGGGKKVTLVKLKYDGNHNPEPLAHERFSRLMARHHKVDVKVVGPLPISNLAATGARFATLTGTAPFTLNASEIMLLKSFVTGGGTLLLDAAGGDERRKGFAKSAHELVATLCSGDRARQLSPMAPLYNMPGMKISTVQWRRGTKVKMMGENRPTLRAGLVKDCPAVLVSSHDITAALVGYPSAPIFGYHQGDEKDPGSAFRIMRNIILYAHR